jgi:hypothetical protein
MRAALLLVLLSLPASADELQYILTGDAEQVNNPSSTGAFNASFTLNTLSGPSSFSFGGLGGCLDGYSFSGANVSNLSITIGGATIVNTPHTSAFGNGEAFLGPCSTISGMMVGEFVWNEFDSFDTPHSLNPKDPLGDFLLNAGYVFNVGFVEGWGANFSVKVTSVPEPSELALMLLGMLGVGISGYRRSKNSLGIARDLMPQAALRHLSPHAQLREVRARSAAQIVQRERLKAVLNARQCDIQRIKAHVWHSLPMIPPALTPRSVLAHASAR